MRSCIDSIQEIPDTISFGDLICHFRTGRSVHISGTGRDKQFSYRRGVETAIGDIELSVWKDAVSQLIQKNEEEDIYQALLTYVAKHCPWWHTQQEREIEALDLHCQRIFENPTWINREIFWKIYDAKQYTTQGGF